MTKRTSGRRAAQATGRGRLAAVGGYGAAGIGGSMGFGNGTVVIESGTIYAEGWDNGSGIGGGAQGSGGTIRINSPGTSRGSAGAHISRRIDIGRSVGPGAAGKAVDVSGGEFWLDDARQKNWPGDWFFGWGNGGSRRANEVGEASGGRAIGGRGEETTVILRLDQSIHSGRRPLVAMDAPA